MLATVNDIFIDQPAILFCYRSNVKKGIIKMISYLHDSIEHGVVLKMCAMPLVLLMPI